MEDIKQKILIEVKKQFLERSPGGTTLDTVLEATDLTENDFNGHFDSMEDVAWTLLQGYAEAEFAIMHKFADQATQQTDDATAQTLAFFKLFYEDFLADWVATNQVPPTGDLFSVFIYGRDAVSEQTYQLSVDSLVKWIETFKEIIQPMIDTVPKPIGEATARELAIMMISINLGGIIVGRATNDKYLLSRQERLFSDYLRRLAS